MTTLTYTERFANKEEREIMKNRPELMDLYRKIGDHDYTYRFSDYQPSWQRGLESERYILDKLEEYKDHEHHYRLQLLWQNDGDKKFLLNINPFQDWLDEYHSPKMNTYRFLEQLDNRGMTEEEIARAFRAAKEIARFVIAEERIQSRVARHSRALVYTKMLGSKNTGSMYVDKMTIPSELQQILFQLTSEVEMYDFECLGKLTLHAGAFETGTFDVNSMVEEDFAYIGGYYFKSTYKVPRMLKRKVCRFHIEYIKLLDDVLCGREPVKALYAVEVR